MEKAEYEPRIKVWKLREGDTREKFKKMVTEEMGYRECGKGVNEAWNEMRDAMRTAAKESLRSKKRPT